MKEKLLTWLLLACIALSISCLVVGLRRSRVQKSAVAPAVLTPSVSVSRPPTWSGADISSLRRAKASSLVQPRVVFLPIVRTNIVVAPAPVPVPIDDLGFCLLPHGKQLCSFGGNSYSVGDATNYGWVLLILSHSVLIADFDGAGYHILIRGDSLLSGFKLPLVSSNEVLR
jgi:hypothetical protein